MSRHILVDMGALQMIFNAMERKAKEEGRPVLQEMVDEVKKSCINVRELKIVDGPKTRRGWVEDIIETGEEHGQSIDNFRRLPHVQETESGETNKG